MIIRPYVQSQRKAKTMRQYALKRIALIIPTVLLVTIIVFTVMRLLPGDPALVILSEGDASFTQEELEDLRRQLGTDRPIVVQYVDWIGGLVQGDLGTSIWRSGQPVTKLVGDRIFRTLELAVLAILIAVVFAVPLGVISAIKPDSVIDYFSRVVALVGISIPTFFAGLLVVLVLSRGFGWLPPLGYEDLWDNPWKNLQQMFLPALALGFYDMAFIARVTRSSMMEIIREDYMRTARAKGLGERIVLVRHGLKNAVLPILTISGWQFGRLLRRHRHHRKHLQGARHRHPAHRDGFPAGLSHHPGHHHRYRGVHRNHQPPG